MAIRLIRFPEVIKRTGMARSTIYLRIKTGGFPKPISTGPKSVGFVETEVESWLEKRIEMSRGDK